METDFSPLPTKNNTLATVSLVLGIAGIPFLCASLVFNFCACFSGLLAIAALVTGFIARQQIKSTGEQGDGRALAGMIVGGVQVVIAACMVLFAIVLASTGLLDAIMSNINGTLK
jgi:hypothetical protein